MSEFYYVKHMKSRGNVKCSVCGDTIPKDEYYKKVAVKLDGDFDARKECGACSKIIQELLSDGDSFFEYWQVQDERKRQQSIN